MARAHTVQGLHVVPLAPTSVVLLHLEHTVSSDALHAAAANSLFCALHAEQAEHVWLEASLLLAKVLSAQGLHWVS